MLPTDKGQAVATELFANETQLTEGVSVDVGMV